MTLSSDISTTSTALSNIKQAIIDKGVTPSGNITTYATAISQISGGSSKKYSLYDRVETDNNTEIGTVSGFFVDSNNVEYAVVCLDSQYRNNSPAWANGSGIAPTNMPHYTFITDSAFGKGTNTATQNTQIILDYCTAQGLTSSSCNYCRSLSFTIDGVTYQGQYPNIAEVLDILRNNSNLGFSAMYSIMSSTLSNSGSCWGFSMWGDQTNMMLTPYVSNDGSDSDSYIFCPVLEIPNES